MGLYYVIKRSILNNKSYSYNGKYRIIYYDVADENNFELSIEHYGTTILRIRANDGYFEVLSYLITSVSDRDAINTCFDVLRREFGYEYIKPNFMIRATIHDLVLYNYVFEIKYKDRKYAEEVEALINEALHELNTHEPIFFDYNKVDKIVELIKDNYDEKPIIDYIKRSIQLSKVVRKARRNMACIKYHIGFVEYENAYALVIGDIILITPKHLRLNSYIVRKSDYEKYFEIPRLNLDFNYLKKKKKLRYVYTKDDMLLIEKSLENISYNIKINEELMEKILNSKPFVAVKKFMALEKISEMCLNYSEMNIEDVKIDDKNRYAIHIKTYRTFIKEYTGFSTYVSSEATLKIVFDSNLELVDVFEDSTSAFIELFKDGITNTLAKIRLNGSEYTVETNEELEEKSDLSLDYYLLKKINFKKIVDDVRLGIAKDLKKKLEKIKGGINE